MNKEIKSFSLKSFFIGILSGVLLTGILFLLITKSSIFRPSISLTIPSISHQVSISDDPNICIRTVSSSVSLIDINHANIEELNSLPGIGEVKAGNIIAWREKYGNFKDISELMYVSGISDNIFQGLCDLITVP